MKTIEQTYHIKAPLSQVWDCFIDPKEIEAWGGGPAKMSGKEGENFSLWGGDIFGTTTEIEKEKKISQDWYGGKWDKPSHVTFTFHSDGDMTTVKLTHTDLPKGEEGSFADGWKDYYVGAIKKYLESKGK
jgi:activator of HSP90 ATPase